MDKIFYHGGVSSNFTIEQIDILRASVKQQNKNGSYYGFYMYGEENYDSALHYAENAKNSNNSTSIGVVKLILDGELNIYEVPPFSITRITKEQIEDLKNQGYDLIAGRMLGKIEYVLLNKDKIKSMEFQPLQIKSLEIESEETKINQFLRTRELERQQRAQLREAQLMTITSSTERINDRKSR